MPFSFFPALRLPMLGFCLLLLACQAHPQQTMHDWFEHFRETASDDELYRFLYAMPKGGNLHSHLSGSARPEWLYDIALAQEDRGYTYYTKVRVNNCRDYGNDEFGGSPYLLYFVTLQVSSWEQLPECERNEYRRLQDLDDTQRHAWMNSIRLDQAHEGRDEFFETHWQRMNELWNNPWLSAEALAYTMKAFAAEGLHYHEPQVSVFGFTQADGEAIDPDTVADIYRARLAEPDLQDSGLTVRFQLSVVRFLPWAEEDLVRSYRFVHDNPDYWVAVNFVGREDDDKGYPLRFLDTLRDLRRQYHGVRLSIHAGEVDEPNHHVRDTLLLGADRIGHGINLITDADTLRQMRHGPYLVEINLISNLLLEYVDNYRQHPFPEYLRMGVPVALSTDDRGMWDSNLSDEYFVAVKEFRLSWDELRQLGHNSLAHAFVDEATQQRLMAQFNDRLQAFEQAALSGRLDPADVAVERYGFICRHYQLCD